VKRCYEEVEHTADIGIWVCGKDLAELFVNAACGMFSLMFSLSQLPRTLSREISIESFEVETLLVNWLDELNYWREVNGEAYSEFDIHEISHTALKATAFGTRGVQPYRLIKAVTFHDLMIKQTPQGCEATIIFDV
jgi:SHS2 domain-containing protein